jgi:hypothetical protein
MASAGKQTLTPPGIGLVTDCLDPCGEEFGQWFTKEAIMKQGREQASWAWLIGAGLLAIGLSACGGGGSPDGAVASPTSTPTPAPSFSTANASGDWPPAFVPLPTNHCDTVPLIGAHATYNVGPGQAHTELTTVPWMSLQAGDVVNIFYRATPYKTKFGLRPKGTAEAPVYLHGVTNASCNRPTLSGADAVTATDIIAKNYGGAIETLGLINIWRLSTDSDGTYTPAWIVIENLHFTNVNATQQFTNLAGKATSYDVFSSPIYAVRVDHLYVKNCEIDHSGLGIFVNTRGQNAADYSSNIFIRGNSFHDNGVVGSSTIHNLYVQARRTLYEGNNIEQLQPGAGGSTIKDRSSAPVIRYNRIVANARAIDLVETEEEYVSNVQTDPLYPYAWVYGNLIINDFSLPNHGTVNAIHWGFDNTQARAHTGTLYFYNNTYVSNASATQAWYAHVFQASTMAAGKPKIRIDAFNNVFAQMGSNDFRFMGEDGVLTLYNSNTIPSAYTSVYPGNPGVLDLTKGTPIAISKPGFNADYTLLSTSVARNKGTANLPASAPAGASLADLQVVGQFAYPYGATARTSTLTLGAFE